MPSANTPYWDLDDPVKTLDGTLYSVVKQAIRGSKQTLCEAVAYPSYVQLVIVMYATSSATRCQLIGEKRSPMTTQTC